MSNKRINLDNMRDLQAIEEEIFDTLAKLKDIKGKTKDSWVHEYIVNNNPTLSPTSSNKKI
jgi:hypothetical protein